MEARSIHCVEKRETKMGRSPAKSRNQETALWDKVAQPSFFLIVYHQRNPHVMNGEWFNKKSQWRNPVDDSVGGFRYLQVIRTLYI